MSLPVSARRLAAIASFTGWRREVERLLAEYDARIAARGQAGTVLVWAGTGSLPAGLLAADGSVVDRSTYPRLFAAIGITYNTGGETISEFRLPNYTTPPEHGSWAIRT